MFFKEDFSETLKQIVKEYKNISEFAKECEVDRSYISKYINCRIDTPPSPKIIIKIAKHSKGVTTYDYLMNCCGYTSADDEDNFISQYSSNTEDLSVYEKIKFYNTKINETKDFIKVLNSTISDLEEKNKTKNSDIIEDGIEMFRTNLYTENKRLKGLKRELARTKKQNNI